MKRRGFAAALAALAACRAAAPAVDGPPRLDTAAVRAHLSYLSDDLLEGRGPGTRGGMLAVRYLETQAALAGLEPGAPDGTYLQPVPLVGVETQPESTMTFSAKGAAGPALKYLDDFVATDETTANSTEFEAPVVFVGHGIDSPENHWNDYEGVDVRGKVVMLLTNEPGGDDPSLFAGKALTYYGRWTYKYEEAARRGARGAIIIHTDDTAGYGWNVVRNSWGRERPFPADATQAVSCAAWVREEVARDAFRGPGLDLAEWKSKADRRGFRAAELPIAVRVKLRAKTRPIATYNVLGVMRGAERPDEAVVFSAHHDHLGIGAPENGDAIYNGAVDNGTGCATVLEIARSFARAGLKPKRSILFAWVAAEEGGLRGSEYYARHPTFAPERIVANLNLDGLPVVGDPLEVAPLGYARSSMKSIVERTAGDMGMSVIADRSPEQGYFFRSDHFNFAKIGVPAVSVGAGFAYRGEPREAGEARENDYRKNRYHRPADQFDASWDLKGCAKLGEFCARIGWELAQGGAMPAYFAGDEFARPQPNRKAP